MKTLIVYYSHTANNEKLALELQRLLDCNILKIEEINKRTGLTILLDLVFGRMPAVRFSPSDLIKYDHIVFVAPIWVGKIATPLKTFLFNEKSNILEYSFITLCGGSQSQKEKIKRELSGIVHREPQRVVELRINDLLYPDQKGKIKFTSGYRIAKEDLRVFESEIRDFLEQFMVTNLK